ncbi:MAG: hypothetical protein K8W52_27140 [Deltaproteobacteria bacterium]|nr:hypothetical protein [Deltaproteobacteria bacterium]
MRRLVSIAVLGLTSACGTYSLVRPAETMRAGKVELAAGLAASQLGEVNTILHAAVAITDDLELDAQNEFLNSFVEARYGILHNAPDGLALAVGLGAGRAITLVSAVGDELDGDTADAGFAGVATVSVGKRWGAVDLTIGNRTFVQSGNFFMSSTRLAARFAIGAHFGLMAEAGGTVHAPIKEPDLALFIGEGSVGFWTGF